MAQVIGVNVVAIKNCYNVWEGGIFKVLFIRFVTLSTGETLMTPITDADIQNFKASIVGESKTWLKKQGSNWSKLDKGETVDVNIHKWGFQSFIELCYEDQEWGFSGGECGELVIWKNLTDSQLDVIMSRQYSGELEGESYDEYVEWVKNDMKKYGLKTVQSS